MHLAHRGYVLLVLTALLAIAGMWGTDPLIEGLWRWPALLLLAGLALEGWLVRRTPLALAIDAGPRLYLGRADEVAFSFANPAARTLTLEYAPVAPAGVVPLGEPKRLRAGGGDTVRDVHALQPARLGHYAWPAVPARILGRFGLSWWPRQLPATHEIVVAPDTRRIPAARPHGSASGQRPRRVAGAGSELHQLRAYGPGDPLSRIDWKATARTRRLVSRELTEDQHLDVVVAIDAGRLSRVRAGQLDRLGLYANLAARFAEEVTGNDDRIGLVVFADRPLAVCAPGRGAPAVARIRHALEELAVEPAESDPVAAAARIRSLLRHRSLVVLLTDLGDAAVAEPLTRAVRLLSPPHLVVVAGVRSPEIAELAQREARSWRDPWLALAAQEHEARLRGRLAVLRRLGVPVVVTPDEQLEKGVFEEYARLRRARRV